MKLRIEFEEAARDKVSAKIILVKQKLWRGAVQAILENPEVDPRALLKLLRTKWTVDMLKVPGGDADNAGLIQDALQEFFADLEQLLKIIP